MDTGSNDNATIGVNLAVETRQAGAWQRAFEYMNRTDYNLARACSLWNSLTNPAAMRTDWEHGIYRKAARRVWRYITARWVIGTHVREWDSGRLSPM